MTRFGGYDRTENLETKGHELDDAEGCINCERFAADVQEGGHEGVVRPRNAELDKPGAARPDAVVEL